MILHVATVSAMWSIIFRKRYAVGSMRFDVDCCRLTQGGPGRLGSSIKLVSKGEFGLLITYVQLPRLTMAIHLEVISRRTMLSWSMPWAAMLGRGKRGSESGRELQRLEKPSIEVGRSRMESELIYGEGRRYCSDEEGDVRARFQLTLHQSSARASGDRVRGVKCPADIADETTFGLSARNVIYSPVYGNAFDFNHGHSPAYMQRLRRC
jgi:hypothetical protein